MLHDLGDPGAERLWPSLIDLARSTRRACACRLVDAVVSLERDHVRRAERRLGEVAGSCDHPVHAQAAQLVLARLRAGTGDVAGAVEALDAVVLGARATGVLLLVPEAAAHRALLLSGSDPAAAEGSLDLAVQVAGDRAYPREQVCVLRARAGLLAAAGRPQAAATMALAAALSARRAALVHQEAESYRLRAALLGRTAPPSPRPSPSARQRA